MYFPIVWWVVCFFVCLLVWLVSWFVGGVCSGEVWIVEKDSERIEAETSRVTY